MFRAGSRNLAIGGDSPQPKPVFPAGGNQPAVNPGSDTYPLDVSAALSEDRKTLTIAVINPSKTEQSLNLSINAVKLASQGRSWQMAPKSLNATVTVDKTPEVEVQEQALGPVPDSIVAPPSSVTIYAYPLQ